MRTFLLCGTVIVLVLASRQASAQNFRGRSGSDAARHDHHDHDHHRHHHHGGQAGWWFDLNFPWIGSGGFLPYYYPPSRYVGYSVFVPPVAAPTIVVVNRAPAGVAAAAGRGNNRAAIDKPAAEAAPRAKVRTTNAQQKARAGRFIGFGDVNFAKQKYVSAVERYKTAIAIAPDVAESYFRQAFALAAMGKYEKAAVAFRRGLRIRSDWRGSPFRLDQIYADAPLPKTDHIESLAKAVEANPIDADLLLVLGMQLFFDGRPDRASVFFARAAQLGGNEDQLLNAFLPDAKPDGAAAEPQENGRIVF